MFSNRERKRFIKFAIVGTIGAVIDFSVFNLLILTLGVPPVLANVFSFTAAMLSNFFWNRFWTYPDSRSKRIRRQLVEFFVVNAAGVVIRTLLFAWLEPRTVQFAHTWLADSLPFSADPIGHNAALAIAMVVVMFWNFFINRYWTYSDIGPEPKVQAEVQNP